MLATVIVGVGARDQMLVAALSARLGQRPALLLVALASSVLAAGAAFWLAGRFAPQLDAPTQRMLAVLALGLAALEMLLLRPRALPAEPTQSLGAFATVLLAQQVLDAARFLLFAIVVASPFAVAAGLGGAIGSMAVVAIGWAAAGDLLALPLRSIRRWLGGALLIVALGLFVVFR